MKNPVILVVLLVVVLFLFSALEGSLGRPPTSGSATQTWQGIQVGQGQQPEAAFPSARPSIWTLVLFIAFPIGLLTFLLWRSRRGRTENLIQEGPRYSILSYIVALIVIASFFFIPDLVKLFAKGLPQVSTQISNDFLPLLFLPLIAVLIISLKYITVPSLLNPNTRAAEETSIQPTAEMKLIEAFNYERSVIDSPRGTVMEHYRFTCEIMARKFGLDLSLLTARELERIATEEFGVERSCMHQLTLLFEKARYSMHEVNAEEADRAGFCSMRIIEALNTEPKKDG